MRILDRRNWKLYRLFLTLTFVAVVTVAFSISGYAEGATLVFAPYEQSVGLGTTAAVTVKVAGVADLYAYDITIKFDPAAVEIVDADTSRAGVQLQLGTFLEPGLVVINTVNNATGEARLALTQIAPAKPKSGNGDLFILQLRGKQGGASSDLVITNAEMSTDQGGVINSVLSSGRVVVVAAEQAAPSPTPAPTIQPTIQLPTLTVNPTGSQTSPTAAIVSTATQAINATVTKAYAATAPANNPTVMSTKPVVSAATAIISTGTNIPAPTVAATIISASTPVVSASGSAVQATGTVVTAATGQSQVTSVLPTMTGQPQPSPTVKVLQSETLPKGNFFSSVWFIIIIVFGIVLVAAVIVLWWSRRKGIR